MPTKGIGRKMQVLLPLFVFQGKKGKRETIRIIGGQKVAHFFKGSTNLFNF